MSENLEGLLHRVGNPATMLRNSQIGAYVYPVVPNEFSNWRDEQRAWRESAILFDQSPHIPELYLKGPHPFGLLNRIGGKSLANLRPGLTKQFNRRNPPGQMSVDGILSGPAQATYSV